jgi:endonuclease YncB( thermonuclease family)
MSEIVKLHREARRSRFRAQGRRRARFGMAMLWAAAFLAVAAAGSLALPHIGPILPAPTAPAPDIVFVTLGLCQGGRGSDCVIDGDTFRLDGQSIRIADIDTPETRDFQCAGEKDLGDRATRRLHELLNAGPFELLTYERDEDRYGRKLRIIGRNGQSLGQVLVAEGLARTWDGARHSWC